MAHTWDPDRYLTYADERGRPFVELLARIDAGDPREVVDLGCGPGNLTALLAERWPDAHVVGVDSSPEMIASAQALGLPLEFAVGDLREWRPERPVDVLVSNATLQWVPDHLALLPALVAGVAPGGWLAFQVPGNFDEPSHTLRAELAAEPAYAPYAAGTARPGSHDPATYYDALTAAGCAVDVWETTYVHVLSGPDPVFTWVSGTSLRPVLQALPDGLREEFAAELKRRYAAAYPVRPDGTVLLPFRRVFAVASRGSA
ncbi:MAG TPA: trans-aconitate 2-methyltransferase [Nocardioides sp.]|uniref:trans-aconitate 2-methyltransferase n=1 Tax=uncultured Nocardioides sp. TaxID=198441 RepID=UPI000ED69706|nr:trans-aconitate 2-methyltransferase [uncultured Nocardioides sp.]HCB05579.1 trans-aconitate 2-methyltransferase [Nocardioides sp.]HRD63169.1 trans-aconitate 2-methyltransferase [Nocardioides sp.]HRI98013.1 trans-aconitate 2-methyltransferase [Nocardioides sp.]HRK48235.1 trans-aconitate 2-methyltransferase [Nocardioides sp.]